MNSATFAGNIGKVRPLSNTQAGQVLNFSLAVKKRKDQTLWIDCALWGDRAAKLEPYLVAGGKICVQGEVDVGSYESNGQFNPKLTLNVRELTLMGGSETQSAPRSQPAPRPAPQPAPRPAAQPAPNHDNFDEDIPF